MQNGTMINTHGYYQYRWSELCGMRMLRLFVLILKPEIIQDKKNILIYNHMTYLYTLYNLSLSYVAGRIPIGIPEPMKLIPV